MYRLKATQLVVALLFTGLAAIHSGCAGSKEEADEPVKPVAIKHIVVAPFQNMVQIYGVNRTVRGPVTRKAFVTGEVAPEAELVMDKVLRSLLQQEARGLEWQQLEAIELGRLEGGIHGMALIHYLKRVARRNQAEAVLVGYLYTFRDREGGNYGARTPASVAFELALLRVDSGAVVWQKGFSETQRPLNENLFEIGKFIQRKGRWVTARDMSKQAMQEMLQTFPWP